MTLDVLLPIFKKLEYIPHDSSLFLRAITHRSFSIEHNERLEFVGDAIIDLIIAEALYKQFPEKPEGELSRYRAELVRSSTLASIAKELALHEVIRLGEGEKKSGGAMRESILSGALEAVLGALYLDADFADCRKIVLALFTSRVDNIQSSAQKKDAKTALQELMQSRSQGLPQYTLIKAVGKQHNQIFVMACFLSAFDKTVEAEGASKKMAEQNAAQQMLDWLEIEKIV